MVSRDRILSLVSGSNCADYSAIERPVVEPAISTFGGVFLPCVCSIFGGVIFLRLGVLVGLGGVWPSLAIVLISFLVIFFTLTSVAALTSTDRPAAAEQEEEFYDVIRFSIRPKLSALLGGLFYVSYMTGTAFYLLSFAEATRSLISSLSAVSSFRPFSLESVGIASLAQLSLGIVAACCGPLGRISMHVVFFVILFSILLGMFFLIKLDDDSLAGMTGFSIEKLKNNLEMENADYFLMFTIFFPGLTGIISGSNMKGLKSPRESIANGTFFALLFTTLVYLACILIYASCATHEQLISRPLMLKHIVDSNLHVPIMYLGTSCAALSSALSNLFGSARILQSLAKSGYLQFSPYFESSVAFCLGVSCVFGQGLLFFGSIDLITPFVTLSFLLSFASTNFACFVEEISSQIFQPLFRLYSRWTSLFGFVISMVSVFCILNNFFRLISTVVFFGVLAYYNKELTFLIKKSLESREYVFDNDLRSHLCGKHESLSDKIEVASQIVRDAFRGKFSGEDYMLDLLANSQKSKRKMQLKRFFHSLKSIRLVNSCLFILINFIEYPSWCYNDISKLYSKPSWEPVFHYLPPLVTFPLEMGCLAFFFMDLGLRHFFMGPKRFWQNGWYSINLFLLLLDFVFAIWAVCGKYDLVLTPILRPIIFVIMSSKLRTAFSSLFKIIPRVLNGLCAIFILILLYGTLGLVLFDGTNEGAKFFSSFSSSILNLFILSTTVNFPDVMMPAYDAHRAYSFFFLSFLIIVLFLLMNLVFASIFDNYKQQVVANAKQLSKNKNNALEFAFHLLDVENKGSISRKVVELLLSELQRPTFSLFHWRYQRLLSIKNMNVLLPYPEENSQIAKHEFCSMFLTFSANEEHAVIRLELSNNGFCAKLKALSDHRFFNYFMNCIVLLNCISIVGETEAHINKVQPYNMLSRVEWEIIMFCFSIVYVAEMIIILIGLSGLKYYLLCKTNCYNALCTVVIVACECYSLLWFHSDNWAFIQILLVLRICRCLRVLVTLQGINTIFAKFVDLVPAFVTLYGMLFCVMGIYGAIGVSLFGGKIYINNPQLNSTVFAQSNYFSNNFNDFISSFITLFELLVVNNWHIIMEGVVTVTNKYSQIYFISFYIIAVVMILNLIVAFAVETFFESEIKSKIPSKPQLGEDSSFSEYSGAGFNTYDLEEKNSN